jgi:glycosyltransferase involved in cell wall biosynthesis
MENHSLLISILVPVYNEEKTILDVLKKLSNIKKFGHSIEVIVINDGSSDNSEKIIK